MSSKPLPGEFISALEVSKLLSKIESDVSKLLIRLETNVARVEEQVHFQKETTSRLERKIDQILNNDHDKLQRITKLETRTGILSKLNWLITSGLLGVALKVLFF